MGNIGQRRKIWDNVGKYWIKREIFDRNGNILDRDGTYETEVGNKGQSGKIMNSEGKIGPSEEILDKVGKYYRGRGVL